MSDALWRFMLEKDPLGESYTLTVTRAELEALLEAHEVETAGCPNCECYDCDE